MLNDTYHFRVTAEEKRDFISRCEKLHKNPNSLMREMMNAVVENRLKINIPETELNKHEDLYNVY